jgi:glycosyltransferase involved in cell wall biosynthesis
MIVKDESHIIEETLNSIKDYICFWVISDTGSTDNTKEIIQTFFKKYNIPGKLFEHKWKDFGTNRTLALKECYNFRKKFDYIWVFDADDLIVGNLVLPKNPKADLYGLRYGKDFTYMRTQIFNANEKWRYVGVLHEYPECISKKNIKRNDILGEYYIDSRRIGNRNKVNDKYERDVKILEKGLEDEPDNTRYMFYLGQSYMDAGNYEKSIEWYKKRSEKGDWFEEVYYSLYRIATCMQNLNKPWEDIEKAFMNAWSYLKSRAEPLYEICKHYRIEKNYKKAYNFGKQAAKIPFPNNQDLFLFKDVYDYQSLTEYLICSYHIEKYQESFDIGNTLLKKNIPETERKKIEFLRDKNLEFVLNN